MIILIVVLAFFIISALSHCPERCVFSAVFFNRGSPEPKGSASGIQWFLPRDASAERGDEIACRLSVRLSVCNVQVP